jgi:EAL domain-containing protein (putative c-di-GMP-specific phosphodiesterase class I)
MAEETGLILPIGNWVLETACAQIAPWARRSETAELAVSINNSARQLRQPEFVDQVLTALERSGADPHRLELELTESMLVDDIEDVISKMSVLKSHGLRFSLSQAMGLPVIAEGVETEEQRKFLVNLGCHAFQGYLFGRPIPVEKLELLLHGFAGDEAPILRGA